MVMRHTIKSRKLNKTFSFYKRSTDDQESYIFLGSDDEAGLSDDQICHGGWFHGSTITATDDNFVKACKKWYRQHMRGLDEELDV